MTSDYKTKQEAFWASDFGDLYITRNKSSELLASNIVLFSKIFSSMEMVPQSVLEIGANIGMNINAIKVISPDTKFTGIEINSKACEILAETGCVVIEDSISNCILSERFQLVLSKGVLIHLSPEELTLTYKKLYEWTCKYILIAEYYNPTPVEVPYRGNREKLFKRDFAGEMLDLYPNLILKDYGFVYNREKFSQDDITWFLLEKR